jgi:hypothetical protein
LLPRTIRQSLDAHTAATHRLGMVFAMMIA